MTQRATLPSGFIQLHHADAEAIRAELGAGLAAPHPFTSPKYLYDELGSKLFSAICALPEYYPTRTEAEIMTENLGAIGSSIGKGVTLIDLGAGNCEKPRACSPPCSRHSMCRLIFPWTTCAMPSLACNAAFHRWR
jgi:uncharacterized SAM-dependent methyltransferase